MANWLNNYNDDPPAKKKNYLEQGRFLAKSSASESTRVSGMPVLRKPVDLTNYQAVAKNTKAANLKEIERRKIAIAKSKSGKFKDSAIADKFRIEPDNPNSIIDEINPGVLIGGMADSIGKAFGQESSLGDKALSIATPLLMGRLAGMGGVSNKKFVNNIVNPFADVNLSSKNKAPDLGSVIKDIGSIDVDYFKALKPNGLIEKRAEGQLLKKEINEESKNKALDLLEHWTYKNPDQINVTKKAYEGVQKITSKKNRINNKLLTLSRQSKINSLDAKIGVIDKNTMGLSQIQDDLYTAKVLKDLETNPKFLQELEVERGQIAESLNKYGDEYYFPYAATNAYNMPPEKINQISNKFKSYFGKLDDKIAEMSSKIKPTQFEPEFEKRVKNLYTEAGFNPPDVLSDPFKQTTFRDRTKIVSPNLDPGSIENLPLQEQSTVQRLSGKAYGFRNHLNTYTYGEKNFNMPKYQGVFDKQVQKVPFDIKNPESWFNKTKVVTNGRPTSIIQTDQYYDANPRDVLETVAHEGGHDLQRIGNFGDLIDEYSDKYQYNTTHGNNPLSERFKNALQEPTDVDEFGESTYETWLSSGKELHSDLMLERIKIMSEFNDTPAANVKLFKDNEDMFNRDILNKGQLEKFFKPNTSDKEKLDLFKLLPAAVPVALGVGAYNKSSEKNNNWLNNY